VISVDAGSFVPIYEQIKKEILRLVATGLLKAHDPLPSIRELAAELLVNPNTVARAYRELEQEGLISTQKGRGSFIAGRSQPDTRKDVEAYLGRILDEAISEAQKSGLGADEILKLFEGRLRANSQSRKKGGRHE
jgi:GntR family transcriptional regulator